MSRSPWSCVLWDVDGTIIDASDVILRRLQTVLTDFGRTPPQREELQHWIGPPMWDSFREHALMTEQEASTALAEYRALSLQEGHASGVRAYPGVLEVLGEVHDAGVPQATASSKPVDQIRAIFEHFGVLGRFELLAGAVPDERIPARKDLIVADALRGLADAGHDISRPVLIGDRHHDVEGGGAHGVPVIFVRWGFSWPHESDGAQAAVDDPGQLRALLLSDV